MHACPSDPGDQTSWAIFSHLHQQLPPGHSNPLWALWHTSSHEVHRILELNMAVFKFSPSYPSVSAISQSCQKLVLWTQPLVQPYAFPSLLAAASSDRKAFDDALPGPCGILSDLQVEGICDRIFQAAIVNTVTISPMSLTYLALFVVCQITVWLGDLTTYQLVMFSIETYGP